MGWLPSSGRDGLRSLILPAVALAAFPAATLMRIVRVSVADVTGADYVRTANAKGLPERAVLWRHVARNAMLPAIAYAGVVGGFLVAGAVAVESVFAWPGIGQLALQSVASRDLPVIQAFVAVVAVLIVLANLVADLIAVCGRSAFARSRGVGGIAMMPASALPAAAARSTAEPAVARPAPPVTMPQDRRRRLDRDCHRRGC